MGQISPQQVGGVENIMAAESLLNRLPLTLNRQTYADLAGAGMDAATVLRLTRLLRGAGRVTETETPMGKRLSKRGA